MGLSEGNHVGLTSSERYGLPDVKHQAIVSCQVSTSAIEALCKKFSSKVN